jgi:hypothetical protein
MGCRQVSGPIKSAVLSLVAVFTAASAPEQERFSFFQASTPESVERILTLVELRDDDVTGAADPADPDGRVAADGLGTHLLDTRDEKRG